MSFIFFHMIGIYYNIINIYIYILYQEQQYRHMGLRLMPKELGRRALHPHGGIPLLQALVASTGDGMGLRRWFEGARHFFPCQTASKPVDFHGFPWFFSEFPLFFILFERFHMVSKSLQEFYGTKNASELLV